jgi:hypothetical protein
VERRLRRPTRCPRPEEGRRQGIDSIKLHFGRKVFGKIFILLEKIT